MNPQLLISTAVLTVGLAAGLSAQAQTVPTTGTTSTTPGVTNSTSTPSIFTPGTNPSGTINYNQSGSSTGSSGFTSPANTLAQPNTILNNSNSNNINSTRTNSTINAFPPYDPYRIERAPSFYNPSIGNPGPSINRSNGRSNSSPSFGTIR